MKDSYSVDFYLKEWSRIVSLRNSYHTYHLISKGKPIIQPPSLRTKYVTILGRDGLLDLSGAVEGVVNHDNYTAEWEFYVDPDVTEPFESIYKYVIADLHGLQCYVRINGFEYRDPTDNNATFNSVHFGRITVSGCETDGHLHVIKLSGSFSDWV